MDIARLWRLVLADLEVQVSRAVFKTILSQTYLISLTSTHATISCRQPLILGIIEQRYAQLIKQSLARHAGSVLDLVFKAAPLEKNQVGGPLFTLPPTSAARLQSSSATQIKLNLNNAFSVTQIRLNPIYTFSTFAVSSSNQMAFAAAAAVAKNPGSSYNPLFLYGGVGVGKTHLMQAIGHAIVAQKQLNKIIYCTGEEFTNEIIEAIGAKTTTFFKKKYRRVDVLLIDDVQFIAGKYAIQEEFFHTFNAVTAAKGQIIMTSDKPPHDIDKLEERLRSRFEGGLSIDIGPADFELRTAILLIKAKQRGIELPIELAKLIAANVENPRKLEGVLTRVVSESQLRTIPLDSELVKMVLGKTVKETLDHKRVEPPKIIDAVAAYFGLKLSQLKGEKRDRSFSLPRQMLYYLLRTEANVPFEEIGNLLGGRDHTTVLHGVRKISELISINEKIRVDIEGIKEKVLG